MGSQTEGIRIKKRDYFKLPAFMRQVSERPLVMTSINGRQTFVAAIIID